mmetsp:Transcript_23800/g.47553  ORF Transcript_23800/g.47553 Transcript_23800/m.47553 type:complete len:593 (+) Transcript_23800:60-1838(+)
MILSSSSKVGNRDLAICLFTFTGIVPQASAATTNGFTNDYYCGRNWNEANQKCTFPCPSGLDSDCPPDIATGRARRCFASAGCLSKTETLFWTGVVSLEFDSETLLQNTAGASGTNPTNAGVPTSTAANEALGSQEAPLMNNEETQIFENSFLFFLNQALQEKMDITSVFVDDQAYDRPCVGAVTGKPDGTTSLDMTVSISSEYIPDGFLEYSDDQFGDLIMGSIANESQTLIDDLRDKAPIFEAATGVESTETERLPEPPSDSPSSSPTRGNYQILETYIDSRPTGSYGILFEVKTRPGVGTILVKSLSFITRFEGMVEYEVFTKLGSSAGQHGKFKFFDLIASGRVKGQGPNAFTRVNENDETYNSKTYTGFQSVHIPGDRASRSFYVTIKKVPDGEEQPPILFSYPINEDNEGKPVYEVVTSSPEIEIFEGDGVLEEPFPKDGDSPYYRRPRGFLGVVEYDMAPCFPLVNFTGWPCPYMKLTRSPTPKPTLKPTQNPTGQPTTPPVTEKSSILPTLIINQQESNENAGEANLGSSDAAFVTDELGMNEVPGDLLVKKIDETSSNCTCSWRTHPVSICMLFVLVSILRHL